MLRNGHSVVDWTREYVMEQSPRKSVLCLVVSRECYSLKLTAVARKRAQSLASKGEHSHIKVFFAVDQRWNGTPAGSNTVF